MKKLYLQKKFIFTTFLFLSAAGVWAFDQIPVNQLLSAYLENDTSLQKQVIEVQKSVLSQDKIKQENGFNLSLSTGNIVISFSEDKTNFSVNPSVTANFPEYNNLKVTGEINYSTKTDELFADSFVSLSADIVSSKKKERELQLLKSERSVLEAKRKLQTTALSVEKTFYNELNSLLQSTRSIISDEKTLYSDKLDFEAIKARGFSKNSSSYRLSEMRVVADEHKIESAKRSLIHDYIIFYKKCGFDIQLEMSQDFLELIPADIQEISPINFTDFDKENFNKIESAEWINKINSMERELKSDFSLAATGGYTYKNNVTKSDTVDGGITGDLGAVKISSKLSVPISGKNPAITLGANFNPSYSKLKKINDLTQELNVSQELLDVTSAYTTYENTAVEKQQALEDLLWKQKTNEENLLMYETLEKELMDWFNQGIISETDYLSAKTNRQLYAVEKIIYEIEMIIYNNDIKSLFVE